MWSRVSAFLLLAFLAVVLGAAPSLAQQAPAGEPPREQRAAEAAPRAAWVVSPVFPDRWHTATAVAELPDGSGYLVAGQRDYNEPGQIAAWVMKVDGRGRTRWWRNFDDAREVRSYGLVALPDGGAFLAGSFGDGRQARPWIARISPKAWVFWEKVLPGRSRAWSGIERLVALGPERLVAAGTDYLPDGGTRSWLLHLSADGETLARHALDLPGPRGISAMSLLSDGTLALAGPLLADPDTPVAEQARQDAWVARVGRQGDLLWDRTFAGGAQEAILALAPDGAGGVLAGGWQIDNPWFGPQGWTRRFAADGTAVGELVFGDRDLELVAGLVPDGADGHWLVGSTEPRPEDTAEEAAEEAREPGPTVAWKRSLDAAGWLGDRQMLGASAQLDLAAVARTGDGGLLVVGWRTIRPHMRPDLWIARFVLPTG